MRSIRCLIALASVPLILAGLLVIGEPALAAFPGANGEILFNHELAFGLTEVWAMNPDGTNEHLVVSQNTAHPAWSPDGTKLASW